MSEPTGPVTSGWRRLGTLWVKELQLAILSTNAWWMLGTLWLFCTLSGLLAGAEQDARLALHGAVSSAARAEVSRWRHVWHITAVTVVRSPRLEEIVVGAVEAATVHTARVWTSGFVCFARPAPGSGQPPVQRPTHVFVIGVIAGALACLLAAGALADEWTHATLHCMLAAGARRVEVLLAKWAGVCTVLWVGIGVGTGMEAAAAAAWCPAEEAPWRSLAPLVGMDVLYTAAMAAIGVACGALTRSRRGALMGAGAAWLAVVTLVPWLAALGARSVCAVPDAEQMGRRIEYLERDSRGGLEGAEEAVAALRTDYLQRVVARQRVEAALAMVSPYGSYLLASQALAGCAADVERNELASYLRYSGQFTEYSDSQAELFHRRQRSAEEEGRVVPFDSLAAVDIRAMPAYVPSVRSQHVNVAAAAPGMVVVAVWTALALTVGALALQMRDAD